MTLAISPPGTVIKRERSLGENGALVHNTRRPYYHAVFSQTIPAAKVLVLAKLVNEKVAG